jgi:hypothetical protein
MKVIFCGLLLFGLITPWVSTVMALLYTPPVKEVLLGFNGELYVDSSLKEAGEASGVTKQTAYEWVEDLFEFNYISYANPSTYEKYLTGELSNDHPDHRDKYAAYFTSSGKKDFNTKLEKSVLSKGLWNEGGAVKAYFNNALLDAEPEKIIDGVLHRYYKGSFYTSVNYRTQREQLYRIEFTIELIRSNERHSDEHEYYFQPLSIKNYTGWKIVDVTWTERRG